MYVKHVDIINIRGYQKASLNLSPGINLLLGANNSGKSTILRCIQKLQYVQAPLTLEDVRKGYNSGKILINLAAIKDNDIELFGLETQAFNIADPQEIIFGIHRRNDKQEGVEKWLVNMSDARTEVFSDDIKVFPLESGSRFIHFKGFPTKENENNFIYPFLARRKTQHYSSQGGADNAYGVHHDFYNLPAKIQNLSNPSHPQYKHFIEHCNDILGFAIGKVPAHNNEDKLGIFVKQGEVVYLEAMGEGVANILGLLTILFTEDNKLFLIEELENDIHPASLKKLLTLILEKSKSNQFIISTHSNIVLKYLASEANTKIFYTEWALQTLKTIPKTTLPTSNITEIENSPEERLRIIENLGYDLMDFDLYKSYIIFEESSAEQVIRDFLVPTFIPSLSNKIKTIAASGADDLGARLHDFLRLFVFIHSNPIYNKRAWVIADGDETGKRNIDRLKDKFKSWPKKHFINLSKPYFEEYYPEPFKQKFRDIMSGTDKRKKHEQKGQLTQELMAWIAENRMEAKRAFAGSAKEVITTLKEIGRQLK